MEMSKREQLMHIMQTHHIDILASQETKVSRSSEEQKMRQDTGNRFLFLLSSKPQVVQQLPQQQNQPARQAKVKANTRNVEHHGVGFVVGPRLLECIKDCTPHSSRLIELCLHNHGPDIHIVKHYTPHSGRRIEEKRSIGTSFRKWCGHGAAAYQPSFSVTPMQECRAAQNQLKS